MDDALILELSNVLPELKGIITTIVEQHKNNNAATFAEDDIAKIVATAHEDKVIQKIQKRTQSFVFKALLVKVIALVLA